MSNPQSSKRHHFVPRFFLNEWRDKNGELWVYQRNGGGGISHRKGDTKSIAYVEDLYTWQAEYRGSRGASDEIERMVMGKIDGQSSIVHKKLIYEGVDSLTANERVIWSEFIAAMIERTPKKLDAYKKASPLDVYLDNLNKVNPGIIKVIERNDICIEAIRDNVNLRVMLERIRDPEFIELINRMEWIIIELTTPGEHFVLGDEAVITNNGEEDDNPLYFVRLAISPTKLLFLVYDSSIVDDKTIGILALTYNILVIQNSERYVIASRKLSDETHTKFDKALQQLHGVK
ncbi:MULTISPECIES: DUF4238 domain-containing protein [Pseudomonas]|uniref:DUF4238 domain-containing protein n=1 Tax=Pseudomonas TaxID=286 RepID=UPI000B356BCB|nr:MULTISPECIES: DUF4238 domain-containing protein [Pseudomonas]PMY52269.1 DUF4238 domain-containing protein [Pseudomonas sp. FW305-53]PMY85122.1 DUF4238 domain-containing protein [Pseudomonas sp. FW303-C2]PMY91179.1 DUF4238 domain-containing protein [Pseudomonas sp. FW305-62]PNA40231.1 DUF4238 domain-containing protein [Pseudomonas sp. FW306-2-2C-A10BC]PNA89633.1 DUF4238 domain-containing protein [Pseudomonas sp. MPR-R3B]